MRIGYLTTPFGRRPAKLALVKRQLDAGEPGGDRTVDKWKVFRDVCEARSLLGLQDRPLAVLNALLSFYPDTDLADGQAMIVFPSNAQLSLRAHGISGATLRRALAALVEAGVIFRRDSPNGKRYARRDQDGDVQTAFGFSLEPLLARSDELALLAQQVAVEAARLRQARETLTLLRRDLRKLISAALEEGAAGNWAELEDRYIAIMAALPRNPGSEFIDKTTEKLQALMKDVTNTLEFQLKSKKMHSNDSLNERHIQNSNTESINESETALEEKQSARPAVDGKNLNPGLKAFPLGLVLRACPQISDYGPGGVIASWRDLMGAAVVVRSMLGVSPSAYQDACVAMGPENAATAMACILERSGHINSAGGYLRSLTVRTLQGEFSLGPALMALLKANGQPASLRAG
ncbi:replication initiation protein RepC [Rhizobium sp. SG_E_25_P2]|uniref:plasmid replication protein RepC n=1 Tax=Rhizobium sp. SG_E_25_P2 TaxID=2879942 RepID=UPI002474C303|nr:plasmid replication protein RepC [Rhizobium sp. SG_E_25_P2]MDH6265936.1 replication initiation protein RepC [Rhizobium sp. SG_E_25_P2]